MFSEAAVFDRALRLSAHYGVDFLARHVSIGFIDDITDVFEVGCEGDDLQVAIRLFRVKRFVKRVNGLESRGKVYQLLRLCGWSCRPKLGSFSESFDGLTKHLFNHFSRMECLTRGACEGYNVVLRAFIKI